MRRSLRSALPLVCLAAAAASCAPAEAAEPLRLIAHALGADLIYPDRDLPGVLREILLEACPGTESRALVLVVDATGSMGPRLAALRRAAPDLRAAAARGCLVAVFAYRDRNRYDKFTVKRIADFVDPPDRVVAALEALTASGGGDRPERVWTALDEATAAAAETGLSARIVLVGDAPAHADPGTKEVVRARLGSGKLRVTVLDAAGSRFPGEPALDMTASELAALFGGRYVNVAAAACGRAVARELTTLAARAPELALVVALKSSTAVRALRDLREGLGALEEAGGSAALVSGAAGPDGFGMRTLVALPALGEASAIDDGVLDELIPWRGRPPRTLPLEALGEAATLRWTAGRARAVILITDQGTDRDSSLERPVSALFAGSAASPTELVVFDAARH